MKDVKLKHEVSEAVWDEQKSKWQLQVNMDHRLLLIPK